MNKQKKWVKKNRRRSMLNTGFYWDKGHWYRAGTRKRVTAEKMRKENKNW